MLSIRRLQISDLEPLRQLYRLFWGEDSDIERMRKRFHEMESNSRQVILCATLDNLVVGSVMGIVCNELYGDCRPFLVMEDLIVDKEHRNHGIGKALVRELEKFAQENSCSQMLFITETHRHDAVSFYESIGFDSKSHIGFKRKL
jgi:ribosomal protein S18 acetylase RimI-like enzyme